MLLSEISPNCRPARRSLDVCACSRRADDTCWVKGYISLRRGCLSNNGDIQIRYTVICAASIHTLICPVDVPEIAIDTGGYRYLRVVQ